MLSPKTPLVGERWDYQVLELDQKFTLQMIENLKGHLVRHLASDQYFPTETLRRGKMRGNSDLKTVCKCMLVVSLLFFFLSTSTGVQGVHKICSFFSFIFPPIFQYYFGL